MQHYIGTDIIEIERVEEAIERFGERFLKRVYTPSEMGMYSRAESLNCWTRKSLLSLPGIICKHLVSPTKRLTSEAATPSALT